MKSRTHGVFAPGATLRINDIGPPDGRAVLLSHPLMMGTKAFDHLRELLAARGYRVIAWDHRGQGLNRPLRGTPEVDLPLWMADAREVIEGLHLRRPHFVGQGLGGIVALRLAAWRPDLIASVTAIAASVEAEDHNETINALADHIEKHGMKSEINLGHGNTPVVDLLAYVSFGAWTRQNNDRLVSAWRERFAELVRIAPSMRAFAARESVADHLRGCGVPVLAIAGAEDVLYPPRVSGEAVAHATGGRYATIEHAGHSPATEQPEAVVKHLEDQFTMADRLEGV